MKTKKITISKNQLEFIQNSLKENCLAKVIDKAFKFIYNKEIKEFPHAYCSNEYNTLNLAVRRIYNNQLHLLNIVEV